MRHATLALTLALGLSFPGAASAALIDRGSGLIYDDVLDITWLQDAGMGGFRNWDEAVDWADTLMFGGFDDWRLPSMSVAGGVPTGQTFTTVDCLTASEPACRDNELGYMAYYNLGGTLGDNLTGDHALILNVQFDHWSGTEFFDINAHDFFFEFTAMSSAFKDGLIAAWAVRPGDSVAAAPELGTLFLLATGLVGLVSYSRRRGR